MSRSLLLLLLSFSLTLTSFAGQLGDFEKAVSKPRSSSSSHSSSSRDDDDDPGFCEEICSDIVGGIFKGLFYGIRFLVYDAWVESDLNDDDGVYEDPTAEYTPSTNAVVTVGDSSGIISTNVPLDDSSEVTEPIWSDEHDVENESDLPKWSHRLGSSALPYVRFDYRWQYLDSDAYAHDYLLEAGYKAVALYGRMTRYNDRDADERLSIDQYYGMVRWGQSDAEGGVQVGFGLGGYVIEGPETRNSGPVMTIPITLCIRDYANIEFRPAWARINERTIGDYDLSISGGYRFAQFQLGYRWLWLQGDGHWLNGPYAGFSFKF